MDGDCAFLLHEPAACQLLRGHKGGRHSSIPQRAWPGWQVGVARSLITSPPMDRKRSMNQVKSVQESGPIHHPQCQPAFLELCPEIESFQVGCQILCMLAAGNTACSPRAQGNERLHGSIHKEQGLLQLMEPTHS